MDLPALLMRLACSSAALIDRCHLIVGFDVATTAPVLLTIPQSSVDARREYEVCKALWDDTTPPHMVGPVTFIEVGAHGFHSDDGHQVSSMQVVAGEQRANVGLSDCPWLSH